MINESSGCPHYWQTDEEEIKCLYCGRMLYRNKSDVGAKWLPRSAPPEGDPGQAGRRQIRNWQMKHWSKVEYHEE